MKPLLLPAAQLGFVILTVVYFTLLVKEFRNAIPLTSFDETKKKKLIWQIIVGLTLWAVFVSAWSLSGMMGDFSKFPFNIAPVFLIPLITALVITFSKTFTEIIRYIPIERFARLQSFRFFVEILLWFLFVAELIPDQMTFEGRNLDILAGITGPVIAYFASKGKISRTGLIVWNILCLCLLINIVVIAILSMPVPFRVFHNEPGSAIVGLFPISWLPGFLVPLAYILHFLSLRKLLTSKS